MVSLGKVYLDFYNRKSVLNCQVRMGLTSSHQAKLQKQKEDLLLAARDGNIEDLTNLLNQGVDANTRNEVSKKLQFFPSRPWVNIFFLHQDGDTVLLIATVNHHIDCVCLLLDRGALVNLGSTVNYNFTF